MTQPLRRFFVPRETLRARNVSLGETIAHRMARVLRLKRGDRVVLTHGGAREYEVQITAVSAHAVTGVVVAEREPPPEPVVEVVLHQALIRPQRFDLVLEKGTEIGVSRFVPLITARAQGHLDEPSAARAERWQRIVREAAEQCGRGRLPSVDAPASFEDAVSRAPGLRVLLWEERSRDMAGLTSYLSGLPARPRTVSMFIGPEGGYDDAEVDLARARGVTPVTLGPRVLRSETAGIVAVALALDALGEMG
jgi:16S rRNA (uracil1498-N3)-methyltransferase